MNGLGIHLLLELRECNPKLLNDIDFIRQTLLDTAHELGATVVGESFHRFSPQGVTGILAIAESHISIHTWPEFGYAAADVFACSNSFRPKEAAEILIDKLESQGPDYVELPRGTTLKAASS